MKTYTVTVNGNKQTVEACNGKAATKQAIKSIDWPRDKLYGEISLTIHVKREK